MEIRDWLAHKIAAALVTRNQQLDLCHQGWVGAASLGQDAIAIVWRKVDDRFKDCADLLKPLWRHEDCQGSKLAPYDILYPP